MLIFVITFSILYRLLNKLHKLEFEKNSYQLKAFFAVFIIIASNLVYIEINGTLNSHFFNYSADLTKLREYCKMKSTFN